MTSLAAFLLGILLTMAALVPLFVSFRRRLKQTERRWRFAENAAEAGREILAATPEGMFLWDARSGNTCCSARLAVLLSLPNGIESSYADLVGRFDEASAARLDDGVEKLRRDGTGFSLTLDSIENNRTVQAVGTRAETPDGRALADLIWIRELGDDQDEAEISRADLIDRAWREIMDSLPLPIWCRDSGFHLTFTNRAAEKLNFSSSAALLAERAAAYGRPVTERRGWLRGHAQRLVEITETPLDGGGTVGCAREIPGRPAIASRDTGREELARILEAAPLAISAFDAEARLRFHNSAYAELWHLDPEWLATRPKLGEILDRLRELRRLPEVADYRAFRDEQLAQIESLPAPDRTLLHLPDGTSLDSVVSPHPEGGLILVQEDVTARLSLERSVNELSAVQRETLDNLHEGISVFGSDGRLKLGNPAFLRLWSLAPEDVSDGIHVTDFLERVQPLLAEIQDWPAYKERIVSSLMARRFRHGRLARSDGSVLDYAQVPLPDGGTLISYLDVSDSARVEEALRLRAEALDEANRLKSRFIANVSQEVRNPVTSLTGFAETLSAESFGTLNARQKDCVKGILETSRHLTTIVDGILDLTSIEAGMMTLQLDSVDLYDLLLGQTGLIRERARRKGLQVDFDCSSDIGWIVADEKRLKQILFNLLSNALRFTPRGGRIRLDAKRQDGEAIIRVIDTGVGVAPSDLETTTSRAATDSSTGVDLEWAGLGLGLVSRFVELHGGRLEVASTPGQGTTVTCYLPTGDVPAAV